jgi:CDP-diacylglycerol--glycerol-3-phosphate 3-phosphatidyltransferase
VIFWLIQQGSAAAVFVFGAAAATDFFDGAIARRTNKETEFGRILDPLTDRLLIIAVVVALYFRYQVPPLWALALLIARDILVVGGAVRLKLRGRPVHVTLLGKTATAVLLLAFLMLTAVANVGAASFPLIGVTLFYAGLALYLVSGFNYFLRWKKLGEAR